MNDVQEMGPHDEPADRYTLAEIERHRPDDARLLDHYVPMPIQDENRDGTWWRARLDEELRRSHEFYSLRLSALAVPEAERVLSASASLGSSYDVDPEADHSADLVVLADAVQDLDAAKDRCVRSARTIAVDVGGLESRHVAEIRDHAEKLRRQMQDPDRPVPEHGWTCFHCAQTFTTHASAAAHFGEDPLAGRPSCIAVDESVETTLRDMSERLAFSESERIGFMAETEELHRRLGFLDPIVDIPDRRTPATDALAGILSKTTVPSEIASDLRSLVEELERRAVREPAEAEAVRIQATVERDQWRDRWKETSERSLELALRLARERLAYWTEIAALRSDLSAKSDALAPFAAAYWRVVDPRDSGICIPGLAAFEAAATLAAIDRDRVTTFDDASSPSVNA